MTERDRLIREIEQERKEKDIFFATHQQSPISPEDVKNFTGLRYYPVNLKYRFVLELHEHKDKRIIKIQDTKGNLRLFLRWGEFRFKVGNKTCVLQAYRSNPEKEELFVPFRDATSGKETYGAGRYIDLNQNDITTDGKWILDFNKAYNPWCAYSEDYACPFVPPENWLDVPVEAGEKNYVRGKASK